jgi:putative ABC transport system substrate-binding protein
LGLGAAIPLRVARGQAPGKVWRIGYLGPSAETAPKLLKAFQEGLAALGYIEGRNVVIEYRWTNAGTAMNDAATLLASARELVALKADVIAASIDPAIVAAKKATSTVPIVMFNASDPVGLGFVKSLAHPGGNVTGLTNQSPELIGKKLQVLLEAVPNAKRVGMLVSGPGALRDETIARTRELAASRGIALQVVEATSASALDAAFAELKRGRAEALLIVDTGGGVFFTERKRLVDLALAARLPAMYANAEIVESGGLMSYAPNSIENYRRAAVFIDKILKGAKPGDIPVEQPTMFELAINLKTAKAMGLAIPPSLLLRVDRPID